MILGPDFREFVEYCERHDVRYLIIGGYAVGVHGHVRYTKDLDVWVEAAPDNVLTSRTSSEAGARRQLSAPGSTRRVPRSGVVPAVNCQVCAGRQLAAWQLGQMPARSSRWPLIW